MKKLFFVSMLIMSATFCRGGTIQWNVAGWGYQPDFNIHYLSLTTPIGGIGISIDATFLPFGILVNDLDNHTAGAAAIMLPISCGTWIDENLFNNSSDPFFNRYIPPGYPVSDTDLYIPLTNDLYSNTYLLAFVTFVGLYDILYGWIELGYDGTDVIIVNSALNTEGNGILAKRSSCIPEPSTALLTLSGITLFLLRRRKRVHEDSSISEKLFD